MSSLAIGFFDGVHLGHQAILKGADDALTFRNHPLSVLAPEKAPRLIMSLGDRIAAIRACGVRDVTVLEFTLKLAETPAWAFADSFLKRSEGRFPVLRCGMNWRFGKDGEGGADWLRAKGVDVEVVPYAEYEGGRISSSRIRACLEKGEIEDANAMMGRRFEVRGQIFDGKGVGRKLGYPTVNFRLETLNLKLPLGVYAVEVGGRRGIANYGLAPTMGDRAWTEPILEVHFLDSAHASCVPLPASPVSFLRFIRPERKFASVEELKRQIAADVELAADSGREGDEARGRRL